MTHCTTLCLELHADDSGEEYAALQQQPGAFKSLRTLGIRGGTYTVANQLSQEFKPFAYQVVGLVECLLQAGTPLAHVGLFKAAGWKEYADLLHGHAPSLNVALHEVPRTSFRLTLDPEKRVAYKDKVLLILLNSTLSLTAL